MLSKSTRACITWLIRKRFLRQLLDISILNAVARHSLSDRHGQTCIIRTQAIAETKTLDFLLDHDPPNHFFFGPHVCGTEVMDETARLPCVEKISNRLQSILSIFFFSFSLLDMPIGRRNLKSLPCIVSLLPHGRQCLRKPSPSDCPCSICFRLSTPIFLQGFLFCVFLFFSFVSVY